MDMLFGLRTAMAEFSDTAAPTKEIGIQAETSGLPGRTEKNLFFGALMGLGFLSLI